MSWAKVVAAALLVGVGLALGERVVNKLLGPAK